MSEPRPTIGPARDAALPQPATVYACTVFALAIVALVVSSHYGDLAALTSRPRLALFFVVYTLFTIAVGYPHPNYGHVSFDRVAQVASILIFGPLAAALINATASLLYPLHRLFNGVAPRAVMVASLHNAGLMTLMILGGGWLYVMLGGPVPLLQLDWRAVGVLLLLALTLQLINDAGMMALVYFRGGRPAEHWQLLPTAVELASVTVGILVAIVFARMELTVFALLLWVLSLGMLAHKQFANIQQRLEIIVAERTSELRAKSLELERQATHDKLTGLFNRRYADHYLDQAMQESRRYAQSFTVALADVDHFKSINDSHSHAAGDVVLKKIARLLSERCRASDIIARYGGEEFLLCFPNTDGATAAQVCEELRAAIEEVDWSSIAPELRVTLSFGLAECQPDFRRKSMLSLADARLYQAKRSGRNQVVAHS